MVGVSCCDCTNSVNWSQLFLSSTVVLALESPSSAEPRFHQVKLYRSRVDQLSRTGDRNHSGSCWHIVTLPNVNDTTPVLVQDYAVTVFFASYTYYIYPSYTLISTCSKVRVCQRSLKTDDASTSNGYPSRSTSSRSILRTSTATRDPTYCSIRYALR
jgi:hypothetical protein